MLKKSTIAIFTAMTTMLSVFSPISTHAEIPEPENIISENTFSQKVTTTAPAINTNVQTSSAYAPVQTTVPYSTIPERIYTITTATAPPDAPNILPVNDSKEITVSVVDGDTDEVLKGVKVHLVETEDYQSQIIKRDFGTLDTDKEDSYTINFDYTFEKDTDIALLTAVFEEIPDGYSPNPYLANSLDFIVDAYFRHFYNQAYPTQICIPLYKNLNGSFNAVCSVIDSSTGEYVDDVGVRFAHYNSASYNVIDSWTTEGKSSHTINNIEYSIPKYSDGETFSLSAYEVPEGYVNDYYSNEKANYTFRYDDNGYPDTIEFIAYITPETATTTAPQDSTTITDITHTTTTIHSTTTIVTTTPQKRNCDICGKEINYSDGIITPLGLFLCKECRSMGYGGTTAPINPDTSDTQSTTTIITTTPQKRNCDICGKEINYSDGVITPLGLFLCKECRSMGYGGTTAPHQETSTLYGDVNNDNKVTISDAVLIMQSLTNADEYELSDTGKINADVYNNGDGITNMDALTIQEVVADKISVNDLPVNE